jgi:hypothetical protein
MLKFWAYKLDVQEDAVQKLSRQGFFALEDSDSPLKLVAICSLLLMKKPIPEVIDAIMIFSMECVSPVFDEFFFLGLDETIRELKLAGMRSHSQELQKIGRVIAEIHNARAWQLRLTQDLEGDLTSAIRDEPFLPQQG